MLFISSYSLAGNRVWPVTIMSAEELLGISESMVEDVRLKRIRLLLVSPALLVDDVFMFEACTSSLKEGL